MYIAFEIGKAFSPTDPVAQFVSGLCIVTNDLTLLNENIDREFQRCPDVRHGISLHYLYTLCAHYREAVKFLKDAMTHEAVTHFVASLEPDAQAHLLTVQGSYTPWKGSFVENRLKPVRDTVFHYPEWKEGDLRIGLERAAALQSGIYLGRGRHSETRYEFADEVAGRLAVAGWGESEDEISAVLQELVRLVLAWTYFSHAVVTAYIRLLPRSGYALRRQRGVGAVLRGGWAWIACLGRRVRGSLRLTTG